MIQTPIVGPELSLHTDVHTISELHTHYKDAALVMTADKRLCGLGGDEQWASYCSTVPVYKEASRVLLVLTGLLSGDIFTSFCRLYSYFDFISCFIWLTPPLATDVFIKEKGDVPVSNSKSTKAVLFCFLCPFTYCKVMVITKETCGEGLEIWNRLNGKHGSWVENSLEEKADKKEQFKVWFRCLLKAGTVGGRQPRVTTLCPLCRSPRSGGHFGTAVSVSPTGIWRWRNPQSLCPSR